MSRRELILGAVLCRDAAVNGMAHLEAASFHQLMLGMLEARGELGSRGLGGRMDTIRQVSTPT